MSRRTQNRNQYESTSTGELPAGTFILTVDSTAGLITDEPMYLVIEPDIPGQREWIRIESITGNQMNIANPNGRDLTGSDGDLTHPAGSKVRSVPTQQVFEDIFSDAEDDELALIQHQTDGGDPHGQAGYLTENDSNLLYVKLVGSTMTGDLILFQDPSLALGAATKQYVDLRLLLSGGTMTGELILNAGMNIAQGSPKDSFTIGDNPMGEVGASTFLIGWSNIDGIVRRETLDDWLPLAGGTMVGAILGTTANEGAPMYSFSVDTDLGMYRASANIGALASNGVTSMIWSDSGFGAGSNSLGSPFLSKDNGDAGAPAFRFNGDTDTGMYRESSNHIGFSTLGIERMVVRSNGQISATSDGTASVPSWTFGSDQNTGMYNPQPENLSFSTDSVQRFFLNADGPHFPNMETTGSAANAFILQGSSNRLQRSTSALKYKEDVHEVDGLADMNLRPVAFTHLGDGERYIGFIADEVAAQDKRAGVFNEDGEVENYDLRSVVAILSAKVNRLEGSS